MRRAAAGVVTVAVTGAALAGLTGCSSEASSKSVRLVGQDSDSVLMLELTMTPTSDSAIWDIRGTYETVSAVGGLVRQGHGTVKAEMQGRRSTFTLTASKGFEAAGSPLVVSGWLGFDHSRWKSVALTLPVESGEVRELDLYPATLGNYNEKVHDLAGVGERLPGNVYKALG